jgi:hypothetical protein
MQMLTIALTSVVVTIHINSASIARDVAMILLATIAIFKTHWHAWCGPKPFSLASS